MLFINNSGEWWEVVKRYKDDLIDLVQTFHPICRPDSSNVMCHIIRQELADEGIHTNPVDGLKNAIESQDHNAILAILNQTWFGIPETSSAHQSDGFKALCELCTEAWVFAENDQTFVS